MDSARLRLCRASLAFFISVLWDLRPRVGDLVEQGCTTDFPPNLEAERPVLVSTRIKLLCTSVFKLALR